MFFGITLLDIVKDVLVFVEYLQDELNCWAALTIIFVVPPVLAGIWYDMMYKNSNYCPKPEKIKNPPSESLVDPILLYDLKEIYGFYQVFPIGMVYG